MASGEIGAAHGWSAEARLVVACIRRECGAQDAAAEPPIVADGALDWPRVAAIAGNHGVLPLVYRRLRRTAGVAPDRLERLRTEFYGNALSNLHMARELARIATALEAAGVAAIAFKGPLLALAAWGDVSLRQFNDLDLLVRRADAARAAVALAGGGYLPRAMDLADPDAALASATSDEFIRPDSDWTIDLHWDLLPPYFNYAPEESALWRRAEFRELEGAQIRTLGRADLTLFLAVHGAKHGWTNLGSIADLAMMLRASDAAERDALVAAARGCGALRIVAVGAALATDVLGAPTGAALARAAADDPVVARLVGGIERRLFVNVGLRPRLYSEWAVPLGVIETWRGRMRHLALRTLKPNLDDVAFLPLPRGLRPLHYAIRPLRALFLQSRRLFPNAPYPAKRVRVWPPPERRARPSR